MSTLSLLLNTPLILFTNFIMSCAVASCTYKQRCLMALPNPEANLQTIIDRRGIINGFGIQFFFHDSSPSLEFAIPIKMVFDCDLTDFMTPLEIEEGGYENILPLGSISFDIARFHKKSMTFHGNVSFPKPILCDFTKAYFYDELDCLLQFSGNGNYIRKGELRWKYASTCNTAYPLDGAWEVQYTNGGESVVVYVQRHFFTCYEASYQITIDQWRCPRFVWSDGTEQISSQKIHRRKDGKHGPAVGESLVWNTSAVGHESITWKRVSDNLDNSWKSVPIMTGNFVHQRVNQHSENEELSLPSYDAGTLWGNTMCQFYTIGLASYHFLNELDEGGNHQAYISYENPRTEMWPDLDNGTSVPSTVPFRNISWDPENRVFKGDILWHQDYGTTWMSEPKWSYEIKFDAKFMFVQSGTVSRSMGEAHQFGQDLVYINAALDTPLKQALESSQSTEDYLDIIRSMRDEQNASPDTLAMLGELAMTVMAGREGSMFDFNL